ncbi:MAG TPA: Asp-tRNA(Asn)/Glu-tRNA(Gln) amidotransferase subunit GatC [Gemmatimonadaceae bacterium]|nr:Asp-tRNA(Asn)/Glu-tRNA(Gln) amidotransferase subunit GatC [Gemmatimonadaceae bacterium]
MAVSRDDVLHVASLARIAIDEERLPELTTQLSTILSHMEILAQVSTEGVTPSVGVGDAGLPLREDAGPKLPLAEPLDRFAPAMRDGLLLVPRLATHEDAGGAAE